MLMSPHNGHWLVAPFSVMLIADRLTHMAPWAEPAASLVVMLMGGLLLTPMLERSAQGFGLARFAPWLAGLAALFWFSLDQAPNWLWGLQVCVLLNVAAAVGVAASLAGPRLGLPEMLGAALAAVIGVYSYAAGLALLPMGFVMILLHPASRGRRAGAAAVWALLSAVLAAHYLLAVPWGPQDYLVGKSAPSRTSPPCWACAGLRPRPSSAARWGGFSGRRGGAGRPDRPRRRRPGRWSPSKRAERDWPALRRPSSASSPLASPAASSPAGASLALGRTRPWSAATSASPTSSGSARPRRLLAGGAEIRAARTAGRPGPDRLPPAAQARQRPPAHPDRQGRGRRPRQSWSPPPNAPATRTYPDVSGADLAVVSTPTQTVRPAARHPGPRPAQHLPRRAAG